MPAGESRQHSCCGILVPKAPPVAIEVLTSEKHACLPKTSRQLAQPQGTAPTRNVNNSCEEEDGHIPKMTKNRTKAVAENAESRALVTCAFQLARSLEIGKLLVHADELRDIRFVDTLRVAERVIWLTGHDAALPVAEKSRDVVLHLPETALTRMSQLKISLLLAVMNNHIELDESIVCLSGVAGVEAAGYTVDCQCAARLSVVPRT